MIFRNMEHLKLSASWKVVKAGDTASDIQEGVQAGVWAVGVVIGSSEMGLSQEVYDSLPAAERAEAIERTRRAFLANGADFTIDTLAELPALIGTINQMLAKGERPGQAQRLQTAEL